MNYTEMNKELMDKLNSMSEEERNAIIEEAYKIVLENAKSPLICEAFTEEEFWRVVNS